MASRGSVPMTDEHKERLIRNLPTLVSNLKLSSRFWAILMSLMVLTMSDKQEIERAGLTDEDRVMTLIEHLQKKSDECYDSFVSALRQTDQRHLVVVLQDQEAKPTPEDVTGAGSTAADTGLTLRDLQLTIVTSVLRLCSKVETWTWAADKVYVPIGKIFTDLVWVKDMGHTSLGNYTEMFKGEEETACSFVFLQGQAGSGKSTLIQMLNVKWCRFIQRKWLGRKVELEEEETKLFSKFNYVVLILMRHIRQGQTLQDAIRQQYHLDDKETETLFHTILQNQADTLLYLEGYDEYIESTSKDITDIAHRRTLSKATIVITSRHSPSYHFPDGSIMPDMHVVLRGFSPDGVSQYVNKYFQNTDQSKAVLLLKMLKESDQLLKLSSFPAILLLMCTLWEHEGSLSDSITGFFLKFVAYVCGRFESKFVKPSQRAISRNILQKYHVCLMTIGEVSVGGLREDKLKLSFLYREVIHQIGETAWQLGFLKRESNVEGEELVVFPHKTLQEFFTAYFVVNCERIKQKELLVKFCGTVQALKESEMIQTFINGLGGAEIWTEINGIIRTSTMPIYMAEKIPALQLSYLAENRDAQVKLPAGVNLQYFESYPDELYKRYFDNDCTALTSLMVLISCHQSITETVLIPALGKMTRLTELTFTFESLSASSMGALCDVLSTHPPPLSELNMKIAVGQNDAPWPRLMDSLPVTLQTLEVSYNKIKDESVWRLSQRLSHLKHLQKIKMQGCYLTDSGAVLELFKNCAHCQSLRYIDVSANKLGDELVEVVNLTQHMTSLRELVLGLNNLSFPVVNRITEQFRRDLPSLKLNLPMSMRVGQSHVVYIQGGII